MKIYVKAYGLLQRYLMNKKEVELRLKQGSTVATVFHKLKKPKSEIWMVSVNGKIANENTILNDGDLVAIFEPVGGG